MKRESEIEKEGTTLIITLGEELNSLNTPAVITG